VSQWHWIHWWRRTTYGDLAICRALLKMNINWRCGDAWEGISLVTRLQLQGVCSHQIIPFFLPKSASAGWRVLLTFAHHSFSFHSLPRRDAGFFVYANQVMNTYPLVPEWKTRPIATPVGLGELMSEPRPTRGGVSFRDRIIMHAASHKPEEQIPQDRR
jgi:hypothetical protein